MHDPARHSDVPTMADVRIEGGAPPEHIPALARLPRVDTPAFSAFWLGMPLVRGQHGPRAAVSALLERLPAEPLEEALTAVEGVHVLMIHDRRLRCWYFSVDGAGLGKLFYDRAGVGSSFLELAAVRGYGCEHLCAESVAEFVLHECIGGGRTLLRPIRALTGDEILVWPENGAPHKVIKRWPEERPGEYDEDCIDRFFAAHAPSLAERSPFLGLTGGADSRWLFCMARRHLGQIRIVTAGTPDSPDVILAAQIAEVAKTELERVEPRVVDMSSDLEQIFHLTDGLVDMAHFHRAWQLLCRMSQSGGNLWIHGAGGELFRDAFSFQDFPMYFGKPDHDRFYKMRFSPFTSPGLFSDPSLPEKVRRATIENMRLIEGRDKHVIYARIYYVLKTPWFFGTWFSSCRRTGIDVISPFLERRNVAHALQCPIRRKMLHAWHRRQISRFCNDIAKIPTVNGYNLSEEKKYIVGNLCRHLGDWIRRACNKAVQRAVGWSPFARGARALGQAPGFRRAFLASGQLGEAWPALVRARIVAPDAVPEAVSLAYLGRLLPVGLLIARILERGGGDGAGTAPAAGPHALKSQGANGPTSARVSRTGTTCGSDVYGSTTVPACFL